MWRYAWLVAAMALLAAAVGYVIAPLLPTRYAATARLYIRPLAASGVRIDPELQARNEAERVTADVVLSAAATALGLPDEGPLRGSITAVVIPELLIIRITGRSGDPERAADITNAVARAYEQLVAAEAQLAADTIQAQLAGLEQQLVATVASIDAQIQSLSDTATAQLPAVDARINEIRQAALAVGAQEPIVVQRWQVTERILATDPVYQDLLLQRRALANMQDPRIEALEAERQAVHVELLDVRTTTARAVADARLAGSQLAAVEEAGVPEQALGPSRTVAALLAGFMGMVLGSILAWRLAERRPRVLHRFEPATVLDIAFLGDIPRFGGVLRRSATPVKDRPESPAAEAFHYSVSLVMAALRQRVHGNLATSGTTEPRPRAHGPDGEVVIILGLVPGSGATVVALNLALAAAQRGRRVVLVDGDLRSRHLTVHAGCDGVPGLADGSPGGAPPRQHPSDPRLSFVPTGHVPEDPVSFFDSRAYGRSMRHVSENQDVVVMDVPPLLTCVDGLVASSGVAGIVLVVNRRLPVEALRDAQSRLEGTSAPVLGYVFNGRSKNLKGRAARTRLSAEDRRWLQTRRERPAEPFAENGHTASWSVELPREQTPGDASTRRRGA